MGKRIPFDPSAVKGPRETPDVVAGPARADQAPRGALTVSALLARVKGALSAGLPGRLTVLGEISNFKRHTSGHLYFSLKDADAQIPAVMFRQAASRLKFTPTDGLEVIAEGRVDLYEAQGKLQLYVEALSPRGTGALELAFRQLVEKLGRQGLFDPARKRPLPRYPQTIGVVTSPTGAAIRDIRRTLARRWPAAKVYLIPVSVQGESAAGEIARALHLASENAERLGLEVLIVGRGGGSIEELWSFNEEVVARAIAACRVPVISGVGHESDTTIADLVADVRAATPTAAAELATPDAADVRRAIAALAARSQRAMGELASAGRTALRLAERSEFFRNPLHRVRTLSQRIDETASRLRAMLIQSHGRLRARINDLSAALRWHLGGLAKRRSEQLAAGWRRLEGANPAQAVRLRRGELDSHARQMQTLIRSARRDAAERVERYRRALEALSYRNVVKRGFSVSRNAAGKVLRNVAEAPPGSALRTELADGEVRSTVDGAPRGRAGKAGADDGPSLFV